MQALILAGGLGTRLRPLTKTIPKPMVPILGKPFLEYQLEFLKDKGITDIVLSIGYLGEQIRDYFGDGLAVGIKIVYSIEQTPMGTGGGVKLAAPFLADEFFVIYGDSYLPIDYGEVAQTFKASGKQGLVLVYDNKLDDTTVPCNIAINEGGLVTKYKKGTDDRDLHLVEAGVLAFKKSVLDLMPGDRSFSLEQEIFPLLIEKCELISFVTYQRFYDIGLPERLKTLEEILK